MCGESDERYNESGDSETVMCSIYTSPVGNESIDRYSALRGKSGARGFDVLAFNDYGSYWRVVCLLIHSADALTLTV